MASENNDKPSVSKEDISKDDSLEDMESLLAPPSKNGVHPPTKPQPVWNPVHAASSLMGLICARIVYHWTYQRAEFILGFILMCSLLFMVIHSSNGEAFGERGDPFLHSKIDMGLFNIHSKYDLHVGDVDHWCLDGGDDGCQCEDPTIPSFRLWKGWMAAHKKNVESVKTAAGLAAGAKPQLSPNIEDWDDDWEDENDDDFGWTEMLDDDELKTIEENGYDEYGNLIDSGFSIDVVFLGDSFTEQRQGTASGKIEKSFAEIQTAFDKMFTKDKGGLFEGLALGIAGDTSPNLLWRIVKGEIPLDLDPKVFWVTIGTNDLLRTQCSEEVVLLGILRVVEEIQNLKPSATIVINSILPMSSHPDGVLEYKAKKKQAKLNKQNVKKNGKAYFDLWPSIKSVNEELEKFVSEQSGIKYFDASKVFVEERSDGFYLVDGTMMPDNIHPSKKGYKEWNKAIAKKLGTIIDKQ
uniref:SGNH hydrolase-type esterase domain-containing protein n=1 Tax=Helicotheca tamesis TaxID=374047 RepID=A0A7S2MVJ4_9STRA